MENNYLRDSIRLNKSYEIIIQQDLIDWFKKLNEMTPEERADEISNKDAEFLDRAENNLKIYIRHLPKESKEFISLEEFENVREDCVNKIVSDYIKDGNTDRCFKFKDIGAIFLKLSDLYYFEKDKKKKNRIGELYNKLMQDRNNQGVEL